MNVANGGFWVIFLTVFLAELGDKTQLATVCFASSSGVPTFPWKVFVASALALTFSSLLGTMFGCYLQKWLNPQYLKIISGIIFIGMGIFFIIEALKK